MITAIAAIAAAGALATLAGWWLTRRSGELRETHPTQARADALGLSGSGPTVVHFSAPWCGPCAQVRLVVDQVCGDLGDVAHVEIDMDTNPIAAQQFSVLSLPTTLIFDAGGRQRYRTTGVPKAVDLRAALELLLA